MKVALGMREVSEENLRFAKQLGVNHIVVHTPELAGDGYWEELSLWRLKALVESAGLELAAIENLPRNHYDKLLLGALGRDEQIEKVCETIKNMGRVGIPILGYNWMLLGVWRTPQAAEGAALR